MSTFGYYQPLVTNLSTCSSHFNLKDSSCSILASIYHKLSQPAIEAGVGAWTVQITLAAVIGFVVSFAISAWLKREWVDSCKFAFRFCVRYANQRVTVCHKVWGPSPGRLRILDWYPGGAETRMQELLNMERLD